MPVSLTLLVSLSFLCILCWHSNPGKTSHSTLNSIQTVSAQINAFVFVSFSNRIYLIIFPILPFSIFLLLRFLLRGFMIPATTSASWVMVPTVVSPNRSLVFVKCFKHLVHISLIWHLLFTSIIAVDRWNVNQLFLWHMMGISAVWMMRLKT